MGLLTTNYGLRKDTMSDEIDYYDVQGMIRDARSEIRGEIDREIRQACAQLRSEFSEEVARLREGLANVVAVLP